MLFFPIPQTRALDPHQTKIFAYGLVITLVIALALPRSLSFLPALWGFLFAGYYYVRAKFLPRFDSASFFFLMAFLLLGLLTALWAPDGGYAALRILKTLPIFLCGLLLIELARSSAPLKDSRWVIIILEFSAFAGLILGIEYLKDFPVSRFFLVEEGQKAPQSITNGFLLNRNLVFLVLLSFPVCLSLFLSNIEKTRKITAFLLWLIALSLALVYTRSQTAQFIAILSILMIVFPSHRRLARYFVLICLLAGFLISPLLPAPAYQAYKAASSGPPQNSWVIEASIPHRLEVWNFIATKIKEKPVFGHGVEATRFLKSDQMMEYMRSDNVMHPHNFFLQVWIEMGLPGVLLVSAFFVYLFRRLDSQPPLLQRYYVALFVATLAVMAMGYGMWQAWQLGMIMAITAFSAMATRNLLLQQKTD